MVKQISKDQLEKLLELGAELVDVRETEELQAGAIENSKHWPLSSFGLREGEISKEKPTIFYCRAGVRSLKAAEIAAGWTNQEVYSLIGGYLSYNQSLQPA